MAKRGYKRGSASLLKAPADTPRKSWSIGNVDLSGGGGPQDKSGNSGRVSLSRMASQSGIESPSNSRLSRASTSTFDVHYLGRDSTSGGGRDSVSARMFQHQDRTDQKIFTFKQDEISKNSNSSSQKRNSVSYTASYNERQASLAPSETAKLMDQSYGKRYTAVVANLGDSRCLLGRQDGTWAALSEDQKPENPKERWRIEEAGGSVVEGRIDGNLSLARAMGDFVYKDDADLGYWAQVSPRHKHTLTGRKYNTAFIAQIFICSVFKP